MRPLYKIFRESDHGFFQKKYEERLAYDSAVHFDLSIKPMDQSKNFSLYYIPTNSLLDVISRIYRVSGDLNGIFYNQLPHVAQEQFIMECIVEELFNTNELEGVRSTREEIARSVRDVRMNKRDKKRFKSMVKSYITLINGDNKLPKTSWDIRDIYDDITQGEIESRELPDGEIFRKDLTFVQKKSGTGQIIHRGTYPEEKIVLEVDRLIEFLNGLKEIPLLIRVAIGHYYFGYIHPFYDGNGRTSRFISSKYLAEALGKISALALSRGCNKYTTRYLEAFEITNSIMNAGEMNYFVEVFLKIILDTLKEMRTELKVKIRLLEEAIDRIKSDSRLEDDRQSKFLFILAQNHFFDFSDGVTVKDLARTLKVSNDTVRKTAKILLEKSIIEQKGKSPAYFKIKSGYFEDE